MHGGRGGCNLHASGIFTAALCTLTHAGEAILSSIPISHTPDIRTTFRKMPQNKYSSIFHRPESQFVKNREIKKQRKKIEKVLG